MGMFRYGCRDEIVAAAYWCGDLFASRCEQPAEELEAAEQHSPPRHDVAAAAALRCDEVRACGDHNADEQPEAAAHNVPPAWVSLVGRSVGGRTTLRCG